MSRLFSSRQTTQILMGIGLLAAAVALYLLAHGTGGGLVLGTLCGVVGFSVGSVRKAHQSSASPVSVLHGAKNACPDVPADVLRLIDDHLIHPESGISQVRTILSDATENLTSSFVELGELVRVQQDDLSQTLGNIKGDPVNTNHDTVTVASLAGQMVETAELLGEFVRLVVRVSKQSMDLYYCVEGASKRLEAVFGLVNDVNAIADTTNLLALNAAIESARAGEAGHCFEVVAREVRQLAQQTKRVSEQITSQVHQAVDAVQEARKITELNASQDMSVLLTSKMRIDFLGSAISRLDQSVREKLDLANDISEQIGAKVSQSIRGLQFEDIARQILERSEADLAGLRKMLRSVVDTASASEGTRTAQDLTALARGILHEYESNAQHKPGQATVLAGDIELF